MIQWGMNNKTERRKKLHRPANVKSKAYLCMCACEIDDWSEVERKSQRCSHQRFDTFKTHSQCRKNIPIHFEKKI